MKILIGIYNRLWAVFASFTYGLTLLAGLIAFAPERLLVNSAALGFAIYQWTIVPAALTLVALFLAPRKAPRLSPSVPAHQ